MNFYCDSNAASRTPIGKDTPIVKMGGTSIYAKSSYYGGGISPSFGTPIYKYSQR